MENQQLKEKLLQTSLFEDNEYLDRYCELIESNRETKKEKFKTQCHHIIPRCYFTTNNLEVDNSKENLVNLLYKDHILAHYYLCLCTSGNLQYKLANAFFHLTSRKWKYEDFDPEIDLEEYQNLYENFNKAKSFYESNRLRELAKSRCKKVICLETKEIYNSIIEASEKSLVDKADITLCCKHREVRTAGNYHWEYLDNYIKLSEEEINNILKIPKNNQFNFNNKIICLETGQIFNTIKEASIYTGLEASTITTRLQGKNISSKTKLNFCKLKDYSQGNLNHLKNLKNYSIICLETEEIFSSITDIKQKLGIDVSNCVRGTYLSCHKKHWCYVNNRIKYENILKSKGIIIEKEINLCQ